MGEFVNLYAFPGWGVRLARGKWRRNIFGRRRDKVVGVRVRAKGGGAGFRGGGGGREGGEGRRGGGGGG